MLYRNAEVTSDQKVLTKAHLRYWFATRLNKLGMKVAVKRSIREEAGLVAKLAAAGGADKRTNQARTVLARAVAGAAHGAGDGPRRARQPRYGDHARLRPADRETMRLMIDGVWIPREAKPRETADPALQALKLLCGLNPGSPEPAGGHV